MVEKEGRRFAHLLRGSGFKNHGDSIGECFQCRRENFGLICLSHLKDRGRFHAKVFCLEVREATRRPGVFVSHPYLHPG